jgi:Negative regulator of sigma F
MPSPLAWVWPTVLMLSTLRVRPDLAEAIRFPVFWVKLSFVACLAFASLLAPVRLSHPGMRLDWVPVLVMWTNAGVILVRADPEQRMGLVFGSSWARLSFPHFHARRTRLLCDPVGDAWIGADSSAACGHGDRNAGRHDRGHGVLPALPRT